VLLQQASCILLVLVDTVLQYVTAPHGVFGLISVALPETKVCFGGRRRILDEVRDVLASLNPARKHDLPIGFQAL
jgi:acetyl-CoA carboxylase beta subunit